MRWVVDAMNVIGVRPDGWWRDRRVAMLRLVDDLERWAAAGDRRVAVVFEGPTSPPIRSDVVEVLHAPAPTANSADHEIVRHVLADSRPERITVVTSDHALADRVQAAGARVEPAAKFRDEIDPRPRRLGHGRPNP